MPRLALGLAVCACLAARPADAQVVGSTLGAGPDVNLTDFAFVDLPLGLTPFASNPLSLDFSSGDDAFGVDTRASLEARPDAFPDVLLDDSVANGGDNIGIIQAADSGVFFGVTDTDNGDTSGPLAAQWTFDTSLATSGLSLSIDFAAMGDFEPSDTFTVETSFDGGAFSPVFTSTVNNDAVDVPYTLEDASVVTLNDPVSINETQLDNLFTTITAAIPGGGVSLTVRFTADTNGGSEAFAFRNLVVGIGGDDGLPGDFNGDGTVDAADYTVWRDNLASEEGDLLSDNGDGGTVTVSDYSLWAANFGASGAAAAALAVPEPATTLLAFAVGSLPALLRRRATRG